MNLNDVFEVITHRLMADGKNHLRKTYIVGQSFNNVTPTFLRQTAWEKYLPIQIQRKVDFIKAHYYDEFVEMYNNTLNKNSVSNNYVLNTKKRACIIFLGYNVDINTLTLVFRSSRAWPTFYIDLIALSEIAQSLGIEKVNLYFSYFWIGQDVVLLDKFFGGVKNMAYKKILTGWQTCLAKGNHKFSSRRKIQELLDNEN